LNTASVPIYRSGLSHLKFFLALSRTPHGLLDMATPAFAALLWHGSFPPLRIILLGLVTAFAGYSAVYALNDLVDYRVDKRRVDEGLFPAAEGDLDGIFVRHPVAHGLLTFKKALLWILAWALLALLGAYLLNPVCAAIFLGGCLLETVYCAMWKSGYLKVLISGAVKTSGAMAAVFAVDPNPSLPPLILLFLWIFFWEVGGQNIPNDWADIEEDRVLQATTIPLRFGPVLANAVILLSLLAAVTLSGVLPGLLPGESRFVGIVISLGAGTYLLLVPAYRLCRTKERSQALALFNRASYYPIALLATVIITMII
jgi:4-hydroxybenzoate polyprenyltransferase